MLKLSEVATMLRCSLSNVYSLVEQGKLAVISTGAGGKGFRVTEQEIERFKQEHEMKREREEVPIKRQAPRPQLRHITL